MNKPLLVIPNYASKEEHAHALIKCISTLRASTNAEVLIVDDGSPLQNIGNLYAEFKSRFKNIEIHEMEKNSGFSKTVNVGLDIALTNKRDCCLINSDIEFIGPGWLEEMQKTEADIVGGLLLYPNMLIQHAGIYFSRITRMFAHRFTGCPPNLPAAQIPCECPVTAALQYIKYPVMEKIGIYDDEFKLSFEDVDYLIRAIEAGFISVYNPKIKALHHESLIRGDKTQKVKDWEHQSLLRLIKKHKDKDFRGYAPTMFESE